MYEQDLSIGVGIIRTYRDDRQSWKDMLFEWIEPSRCYSQWK